MADRWTIKDFASVAQRANKGGRFTWADVDPRGMTWHDEKARILRDIARLVRDGYLVESPGPRGGKGWALTPAGMAEAQRLERRFLAAAERAAWPRGKS